MGDAKRCVCGRVVLGCVSVLRCAKVCIGVWVCVCRGCVGLRRRCKEVSECVWDCEGMCVGLSRGVWGYVGVYSNVSRCVGVCGSVW